MIRGGWSLWSRPDMQSPAGSDQTPCGGTRRHSFSSKLGRFAVTPMVAAAGVSCDTDSKDTPPEQGARPTLEGSDRAWLTNREPGSAHGARTNRHPAPRSLPLLIPAPHNSAHDVRSIRDQHGSLAQRSARSNAEVGGSSPPRPTLLSVMRIERVGRRKVGMMLFRLSNLTSTTSFLSRAFR